MEESFAKSLGELKLDDKTQKPSSPTLGERNAECVFLKVETTGLKPESEIMQITAIRDLDTFERYVIPLTEDGTLVPSDPGATKVNHLTVENGVMLFQGAPVDKANVRDLEHALEDFLEFLCQGHLKVFPDSKPVIDMMQNPKKIDITPDSKTPTPTPTPTPNDPSRPYLTVIAHHMPFHLGRLTRGFRRFPARNFERIFNSLCKTLDSRSTFKKNYYRHLDNHHLEYMANIVLGKKYIPNFAESDSLRKLKCLQELWYRRRNSPK